MSTTKGLEILRKAVDKKSGRTPLEKVLSPLIDAVDIADWYVPEMSLEEFLAQAGWAWNPLRGE